MAWRSLTRLCHVCLRSQCCGMGYKGRWFGCQMFWDRFGGRRLPRQWWRPSRGSLRYRWPARWQSEYEQYWAAHSSSQDIHFCCWSYLEDGERTSRYGKRFAARANLHPSMPKLSIGLPVYNGEKFVRRSIESLLAQDYRDFELIITDNQSTDDTTTICQSYARSDSRIRYFLNESNIGAA